MVKYFKRIGTADDGNLIEITRDEYNTILAGWQAKYQGTQIKLDGKDFDLFLNGKCVAGHYEVETARRHNIVDFESFDGHSMNFKLCMTTFK